MYSNILDAYIKQPCDRQDNFFTDEVKYYKISEKYHLQRTYLYTY